MVSSDEQTPQRGARRAVRKGTEDPDFRESDWVEERPVTKQEQDAEAERILREKPPHWS